MTTENKLATVLRYAYLHNLNCEQWIEPTKECLKDSDQVDKELCDLLLTSLFSFTRASDPLLESYITIATTGQSNTLTIEPIISPHTFIRHLFSFLETTAHQNPYQWSYLLKSIMPTLLTFNTDTIISDLHNQTSTEESIQWVDTLRQTLEILSHLVAIGLYSDGQSSKPVLHSASSFQNTTHTQTALFDSQLSFQSQQSTSNINTNNNNNNGLLDVDATLDMDNTQQMLEDDIPIKDTEMKDATSTTIATHHPEDDNKSTIEVENAIMAAEMMIHLIEKRDMKRIFETRNTQCRQQGNKSEEINDPWIKCQEKLDSKKNKKKDLKQASDNLQIQKVLTLIQRLTDRDLERKIAVHMKYHELEDEGTARAIPSAGLMGLLYHLVQVRPSLDDDSIIDHLLKLQTIKGSFDESFYLEIWFTALTGLREASLSTSCQNLPEYDDDDKIENNKKTNSQNNSIVATNRLLWKSLVFVKIPFLLDKLQKKKQEMSESPVIDESKYNPLESSLKELKAFTGLLNACSSNNTDEVQDNISKVENSIRILRDNDVFTNIVLVCQRHGFVRPRIAAELLKKKDEMEIEEDTEKLFMSTQIIDQYIDSSCESILNTNNFKITVNELLSIGISSPLHLRKISDCILKIMEKATQNFDALSAICEALLETPSSLDLILQLYTPQALLSPLESICNHWEPSHYGIQTESLESNAMNELEGMQLLYFKFGKIWKLVVSAVKRFKLYRNMDKVFKEKDGFVYKYFTQGLLIYGVDLEDESIEPFIQDWMNALFTSNNNGLSEDLLRNTKPQVLLMMIPTIIQRSILFSTANQQQTAFSLLKNLISYFQSPFLDFTLSGIFPILCEELLRDHEGSSYASLTCLRQLIMTKSSQDSISLHPVLGSLESLLEFKRQESELKSITDDSTVVLVQGMTELMEFIKTKTTKLMTTEDYSHRYVETITTGVTPSTLFEKAELMFKSIVKSGRSMFMRDVDVGENQMLLWDETPQQVCHYLDMVLFETALEIGGARWFVRMIVEQVLEAGRSGGAVRAAEFGSCLITTPLLYSVNQHNSCIQLLQCLLQDILPSRLLEGARQGMSYFQGQTLGVFTSDCLVLMAHENQTVNQIGRLFFDALVIDQSIEKKKNIQLEETGTRFADWSEEVISSAVWRGFIKGLMSNPIIEEVWPKAFV
ncbi:mediator complex subunit Med5-domain-containing protein [Cokeromyces recurvatus]|uniref:mediator complex subunit Med5-domain-containing protein n=1 Tax=Cokeromyces recurvatus TaxID=90255 RepID=UPI00221ECDC7|nr:mediator complex subunit Med5-domain-containing protein [Cokeromyces recurvatus]KAI7902556.1 mediator complex subunit Med5-domain-containing protein [Cokeromyces recurvatus]